MSNKAKTTAMTNDPKPALTPKLRFPEFRDAEGWDADQLGEVADFVSEKIPLGQITLASYVSTENILADFGGVTCASKLPTTGSVTRYRPNDTLVSNIRPYLKKVWVADKEGGASNDVIVIRAKQPLLKQYLSCLLKNDAFINYVMTGAKGVKMPRGDVGSMKEYPTFYPSKPEQQKIADCVTSVDELIVVQTGKLDVLKAHKDGLMQQLFPREGETNPRIRFPEFQGSWSGGQLESLCVSISSGNDQRKADGEFDLYGSTGVIGKTARASYHVPHILVARVGANAGHLTRAAGQFGVTDNTLVISLKSSVNMDFVYYYLENKNINKLIFGSGQPLITGTILKNLQVFLPSSLEQRRVAGCLAALDDLIAVQTQKVEVLKAHKKGLMQELFPSMEDA
ncbi:MULTISPECIES: restriction endonuclease subunit S [unclassified Bradyrhizobium]|uniref:restriction endonuclease subunit S n=1 Tax=unclassified Bradyrhizobium TaxID=2631580 RepID=UPI0028E4F33C|nr:MULTISPECIES: restriction endonuclease subunit S [unclassified Bradyrhizobium]